MRTRLFALASALCLTCAPALGQAADACSSWRPLAKPGGKAFLHGEDRPIKLKIYQISGGDDRYAGELSRDDDGGSAEYYSSEDLLVSINEAHQKNLRGVKLQFFQTKIGKYLNAYKIDLISRDSDPYKKEVEKGFLQLSYFIEGKFRPVGEILCFRSGDKLVKAAPDKGSPEKRGLAGALPEEIPVKRHGFDAPVGDEGSPVKRAPEEAPRRKPSEIGEIIAGGEPASPVEEVWPELVTGPEPINDLLPDGGRDAAGEVGGEKTIGSLVDSPAGLGAASAPAKRPLSDVTRSAPPPDARAASVTGEPSVCLVSATGDRFSFETVGAVNTTPEGDGFLAGLRNGARGAALYELLENEIFPSDFMMDLGDTTDQLVNFSAHREPREEILSADGETVRKIVAPVTITPEGAVRLDEAVAADDLAVFRFLVVGGRYAAARAGLAQLEEYLAGLGRSYRVEVEYHEIAEDGVVAPPETFAGLAAFEAAMEESDGEAPIALVGEKFSAVLDQIGGRIAEAGHESIDHVFLLKFGFTLPEDTAAEFGAFLDEMARAAALPRTGRRPGRWLTIISGYMVVDDLSNAYLAQPLRARLGRGTVVVQADDVAEGPYLEDPAPIGESLARILKIKMRLSGREERAPPGRGLVLNGLDIFKSTGVALSIKGLIALDEAIEKTLTAEGEPEWPRGLGAHLTADAALTNVNLRNVGPDWLTEPHGPSRAQPDADWRLELAKLKRVISTVAKDGIGREAECTHFYLPLAPSFTRLEAGD